jgi:5-methylcytosine-specific restriction endonuclease McrA
MRTVLGRLGLMPLAKPLTSTEGHKILARDLYRCQYCGLDGLSNFENSLVMTVDFVLPRARKGPKKADNLVAACRACNVIKGHRVFKSFEEARAYVLTRRSELRAEWEHRVEKIQAPAVISGAPH